ncbi:MAG: hypothetical protein ACJ8IR_05430 [Alphaproteobacteria bacterium]
MNGTIAQLVALTCHANAALNDIDISFWPGNSTCKFCRTINFVTLKKSLLQNTREIEVASNPNAWFEYLRNRKASGASILFLAKNDPAISDRQTAGFVGGGGYWSTVTHGPTEKSDSWMARWSVTNRNDPQRKIWSVNYGLVSQSIHMPPQKYDLPTEIATLESRLLEIKEFAKRNNLDFFKARFQRALDCLHGNAEPEYHRDLAPPNFPSDDASLLLKATQPAWVFGGMGSWNDMWFVGAEQLEYERVSDNLFQSVNRCIVAAVNDRPKVS